MNHLLNVLLVISFLGGPSSVLAAGESSQPIGENKTTLEILQSRLRFQQYTEFMTPSLGGDGSSIMDSNGDKLTSTNADGRFWADYEFSPNWRILYWQRYIMEPGNGIQLYDPRIGLRRTQVFADPNLSTTYDLYVLPGVTQFAERANRSWSLGSRTNTSYSIPGSRWSASLITELTWSFPKAGKTGSSDLSGFLVPGASYSINSIFSTQHWFVFPFKHKPTDAWSQFNWDLTGMPFVQNGIGINAHKRVWVGVFINNYLLAKPTLRNTWASVWLNLSFL